MAARTSTVGDSATGRNGEAIHRTRTVYRTRLLKRFRRTKEELAELDDAIMDMVREQKPMTVRQAFYQAEVRGFVPKEEKGYHVVQRRLVAMRHDRRMPYGWITDNVRWVHGHTRYGGVLEFAQEAAELYHRDYWRGADVQVEVWLEKDALASVLSPVVVNEWGLDLYVTRGFASISYLHSAAEAIADDGRPAFIYVLTDLDPSGISIFESVRDRLPELAGDKVKIVVVRLAVTPEQVRDWALPSRPNKENDTRRKRFETDYGQESVELDAIRPNDLRQLVSDAIASHADLGAIARMRRVEELERETIAKWQESTRAA